MDHPITSPVTTPGSTRPTSARPSRGYEGQPAIDRPSRMQRAARAARDIGLGLLVVAVVLAPYAAVGHIFG